MQQMIPSIADPKKFYSHIHTHTFAQLCTYIPTPSNQLGNHQHITTSLGVQVPVDAHPSCCSHGFTSSTCNSDIPYNLSRSVHTTASSCPRRCPLHPKVEFLCAAPALPAHCWVQAAPGASQGSCTTWPGQRSGWPRGHCQQGQTACDSCCLLSAISPRCHKYSSFFYFFFPVCLFVCLFSQQSFGHSLLNPSN